LSGDAVAGSCAAAGGVAAASDFRPVPPHGLHAAVPAAHFAGHGCCLAAATHVRHGALLVPWHVGQSIVCLPRQVGQGTGGCGTPSLMGTICPT
jgi:hypothetical protein